MNVFFLYLFIFKIRNWCYVEDTKRKKITDVKADGPKLNITLRYPSIYNYLESFSSEGSVEAN